MKVLADYFFEAVLSQEPTGDSYNMAIDIRNEESRLWLHLPGALKLIKDSGVPINFQTKELQASLHDHPSFEKSNETHRFGANVNLYGEIKKSWVFNLEYLTPIEDEGLQNDFEGYKSQQRLQNQEERLH